MEFQGSLYFSYLMGNSGLFDAFTGEAELNLVRDGMNSHWRIT